MKWNFIKLGAVLGLMLTIASAYAGSGHLFNVSASGAPGNVSITLCLDAKGPLSCQQYDVTALTLSITPTINHTYPNAGIISNNKAYSPAGCTKISNGYCLFSTSPNNPAVVTLVNNTVKQPRFAYVSSWGGDMLTLCSVTPQGTFTNCNPIPGPNSLGVNQFSMDPGGIVINPAGTIAYVADFNVGVIKCSINSTTGALSNCAGTGPGSIQPDAISLNAAGTYAYIGNYTHTSMHICKVNAETGELTNCFLSTYTPFADATNVVFNSAGTKAYVGGYDITQVYLCDVNQTSGDLSGCVTTPSSPPANMKYTTGVALNSAGNILYVVSNDYNLVYKCPVNADATLGTCTTTGTGIGNWSGFTSPFGIVINAAGTTAYIPNYNSDDLLTTCSIDASGDLVNCMYTGSRYTKPLTVAFLYNS